jgi:hypothetical protein
MPVWSVQFYDENYDLQPSRYGVVKADTEGEAFLLAKANKGAAKRADVIQTIVRDESAFKIGYFDLPSR